MQFALLTYESPEASASREKGRTYLINNRGDEAMGSTWIYLDITALGRQEEWEDSPEGYPQPPSCKWWNWHDENAANASPHPRWSEAVENAKVTVNIND